MRFVVPQSIDVPEKVVGPLTFSQIIYILGSVGVAIFLFSILPNILAVPIVLAVGIFALLLAFYRPFNQHFIVTLRAVVHFFKSSRLFVWKKTQQSHIQIKNN